jgi:hypothetical protein
MGLTEHRNPAVLVQGELDRHRPGKATSEFGALKTDGPLRPKGKWVLELDRSAPWSTLAGHPDDPAAKFATSGLTARCERVSPRTLLGP